MKSWEPPLPGQAQALKIGLRRMNQRDRCSRTGRLWAHDVFSFWATFMKQNGFDVCRAGRGTPAPATGALAVWHQRREPGRRIIDGDAIRISVDADRAVETYHWLIGLATKFYLVCGLPQIRLRDASAGGWRLPLPKQYPPVRGTAGDRLAGQGLVFEFVSASDQAYDLGWLRYIRVEEGAVGRYVFHASLCPWFERYLGTLVEALDGRLPFRFCPIQVLLLPVAAERVMPPAIRQHASSLLQSCYRVQMSCGGPLRCRIAKAFDRRVPVLAVYGEGELSRGGFDVRVRGAGRLGSMSSTELLALCAAKEHEQSL